MCRSRLRLPPPYGRNAPADTTKLSTRGQVVIPEAVRTRLGLEAGTRFVVVGEGDTVILKAIRAPGFDQFEELLTRAREAAAAAGLEPADVEEAIARARKSAGR